MRKLSLLFAIAIITLFSTSIPVVHAKTIVGTDNLKATVNVPLSISDIQIEGESGNIPVKLLVSHGTLSLGTTEGLTFSGTETGSELYFSGDISDVNAALATLLYTRTTTGTDTLEISLVEEGEVFFSDNNHLYEFISVPDGITWTAAQVAAAALERYGASGYLATITSEEENTFVAERLAGAGWMGASDSANEGVWRWVTGPETGTALTYTNWNSLEPNNAGGNEDCGQFLAGGGQNGKWNDLPCSGTTLNGYVVEFGALGDLPETVGRNFTITTHIAPEAISLSPAENTTDVQRTTDLSITFNEEMEAGAGNITVYRSINDSILTIIDVASNQVSGLGTPTITINPEITLPPNTELYIHIDSSAFNAVDGGSYAGINDKTTWSFTTIATPPEETRYIPIKNANVEIINAQSTCDGEISGSVRIHADGASQYFLSNDPFFLSGSWQTLINGSVTIPWNFVAQNQFVRVYGLARNATTLTTSLFAESVITMHCEDHHEENNPESNTTTETDTTQEEARTGISPWNGSVETITDTSNMTLIKGKNFDTVYLLEDGTRRPFMNEAIYFTHFTDFSKVHTVSDATLSTITLGAPVLPKEGVLIKIESKPEVFVVEGDQRTPSLRHIATESEARASYGQHWAKQVIDLDATLFHRFLR